MYKTPPHKHVDFYMYNKNKLLFIDPPKKILGNYLVEAWLEHQITCIVNMMFTT